MVVWLLILLTSQIGIRGRGGISLDFPFMIMPLSDGMRDEMLKYLLFLGLFILENGSY